MSQIFRKIFMAFVVLVFFTQYAVYGSDSGIENKVSTFEELKSWVSYHSEQGGTVYMTDDIYIDERYTITIPHTMSDKLTIDTGDNSLIVKNYFKIDNGVQIIGSGTKKPVVDVFNMFVMTESTVTATSGTAIYLRQEEYSRLISDYATINAYGDDCVGIYSDKDVRVESVKINTYGNNSVGIYSMGNQDILYCSINSRGQNARALVATSSSINYDAEIVIDTSVVKPYVENVKYITQRTATRYDDGYIDFNIAQNVLVGTSIDELIILDKLEALIEYYDEQSDELYSDFINMKIKWNLDEYDGEEEGTYTIIGRFEYIDENIPLYSEEIIELKVNVLKNPIPPVLPEYVLFKGFSAIIRLDYFWDGCESVRAWVSTDAGFSWEEVVFNNIQDELYIADEVFINTGYYTIETPSMRMINLDKKKIYKYKIQVIGGARAGMSNIMTLSYQPITGTSPDDNDDDDDDIEGNRGGGNRYLSSKGYDTLDITQSQLQSLIKANKTKTTFIIGNIKVIIPTETLKELYVQYKNGLNFAIKDLGSGKYDIKITSGSAEIRNFKKPGILIYIPYEPNISTNIESIVAINNNIIKTSYYDYDSKNIIITADSVGSFEIVERNKIQDENLIDHWAQDAVQFLISREIVYHSYDKLFELDKYINSTEFIEAVSSIYNMSYEGLNSNDNDLITREEAAYYTYQIALSAGVQFPEKYNVDMYVDKDLISEDRLEAIGCLYYAGVIKGKPNNRFDPKSLLKRGEGTIIIMNLIKLSYGL